MDSLRDVGPVGLLVPARDDPAQRYPPGLRPPVVEPEAAEGDGHSHHVALRRELPIRVPEGVEGVVLVLTLDEHTVELDA